MLYVVTGPPAAGKSTWVREHAGPDDIVIDYDLIANALTAPSDGQSTHKHPDAVKAAAKAARQAAIDKALTITGVDVYLIHSTPSERLLNQYRSIGAEIITVDPGFDIVMARAKKERPWQMQQVIKQWYANQEAPKRERTTTEKGLGWQHQKQRERLLRNHVDGSPCWWCTRPMFKDRTKNWDHNPASTDLASGSLAADHSHARSHGGTHADRLLHGKCNKERQDGSRDHLRPAITGLHGPDGSPVVDDQLGIRLINWP